MSVRFIHLDKKSITFKQKQNIYNETDNNPYFIIFQEWPHSYHGIAENPACFSFTRLRLNAAWEQML